MMAMVYGRSEHKVIVLNELNQPIGPTKKVVAELSSFLGTLARNGTFCPLNVMNWMNLKTHDDMWNYIKYVIPEDGKDGALGAINLAWRGYKSRLKNKHFYAYATEEIRMTKRPKFISESVLKDVLKYCNSDEAMEISNTNKQNRQKLRYPHTIGKTSFAVILEEKKKETTDALSSKDLFVATRKRKLDRVYKDSYEDMTAKIVEMDRIETQETEDGSQSVDAFETIMGRDHPGQVRLYGLGVTKTLLKQKEKDSGPTSNTVDDEMMQKSIEEIEERMQLRMKEKINAQKDTMEQNITMNIISQLQHLNPGLTIDPNMLKFNISNNQGFENEESEEDGSEDDLDIS